MQSGLKKTKMWIIEFEFDPSLQKDVLMGWNSSTDTKTQIKLFFETKEQAIQWAKKSKYQYFVEEAKIKKIKIKSYASNFDMNKKEPWTH